ncbi:MAG: T9SS type A sorting domain-containing protein [bacterium]
MKKGRVSFLTTILALVIILILLAISFAQYTTDDVIQLFWVDRDNVPTPTEDELRATAYFDVISYHDVIYKSAGKKYPEMIDDTSWLLLIVVNDQLYPQISNKLSDFITQTESNGYKVELWSGAYATAEDLRNDLKEYYDEKGFYYCFMIGTLPVALSEIGFFDGETTPYPIDLFFMDLNGIWKDNDNDGYYDEHTGDVKPEISFGRVYAGKLEYGLEYSGALEADFTNNYIDKVITYCNGEYNDIKRRALSFIDDDWFNWSNEWSNALRYCYKDVEVVADSRTIDTEYEDRLDNNYETILLCAHSNPNAHYFKIGSEWTGGQTWYYEVYNIKPVCNFFNLFACSNCQYTYKNCMGCWYIHNPSNYGLTAVGSTKTGSMLYFEGFYAFLGIGYNFGDAFRKWFSIYGEQDRRWFYGMTLLGNPLLKISSEMNDVNDVVFRTEPFVGGICLYWEVFDEEGITGYNIYRSIAPKDLTERTFLDIGSNTLNWQRVNNQIIVGKSPYKFVDKNVDSGVRYIYRLEAVYENKAVSIARTGGRAESPSSFSIEKVYPVPADSEVHLIVSSKSGLNLGIKIYDISGRVVREEVRNLYSSDNELIIDTEDLNSGVYLLSVYCDGYTDTIKILVEKY